jgi:putative spermidine/putrescine transport system substrate-binding protein
MRFVATTQQIKRRNKTLNKKRLLTSLLAIASSTVLLAGCSSSGSSEGAADASAAYQGPVGDTPGTINILAWPGYAEDGSTDPAVDWVTPFEKESGCQVNVKTYGTSDEAVQLMQSGGYDVVSASGDASLRLIYGGDLQPVNLDLIPNYADIFDNLKDRPWNTVDGANYGVPHGRGANVLQYTIGKVDPAPDSWSLVWEANSPAAGKITAYDSAIYIADAAVYLMSTKPELGITDPYALDQTQFDAAMELLKQQKPLVGEYWADYTKYIEAVKSGTIVAGTSWQVIANVLNGEAATVGAVKPKEGATGWSDTWMISKNVEAVDCAYKWLNWIIKPDVNAQAAEWFGEAPANSKACALTANKDHCTLYHAEETDYWSNVYYWKTPTETCLDGRTNVKCVPYSEWVKAWSSFRSA